MANITFKQEFTFSEEGVYGFAKFLGWQEKITVDGVEIDNPMTFIEYVKQVGHEHTLSFTRAWAEQLKRNEIQKIVDQQIAPQVDLAIIKPVEDALTTEVIVND